MNDMVANNLALVQSDPALMIALQLRPTNLLPRSEGSLESIDALSANWSSLKSELAAVSGLTLTAYPGSTKETVAAEVLQNLPTGIFRLRAQRPVSVLSGNKLGANYRRRDCAGTWTAFVRVIPEPRFEFGVRGGRLGNDESRMDS